jgi:hypothetical protein
MILMAHFSLFVFLAFLQGVCPVSAQIISIQDTNVNVIGLYVDGLKGEASSSEVSI